MKKLITLCFAAVITMGVLSGCKKEELGGNGKIHVTNNLWVSMDILKNGTKLGTVDAYSEATWEVNSSVHTFRATPSNLNLLIDDASTTKYIEPGQTFHWTLNQ